MKAKFTGKERDPDTGSDYFGVRWFRSSMARFYSPSGWRHAIMNGAALARSLSS
jgi:RHS repeat-associated protein